METQAAKLRQKAINLLYLIFLAFLFSFIPSEFVDTTQMSNTSMNLLCNEVERQSNKYNLLVLSYIQQDEELFNDIRLKLITIDEKTNEQIRLMEKMKLGLMSKEGFNKFGYLVSGKSENPSNEYMIAEKNAENLFKALHKYKADMGEYLSAEDAALLDSILPLPELTRRSDGEFAKSTEFFFKKNPLNVAILNISHFKSRVERTRTYTISKIIEDVSIASPTAMPEEIVKIIMEDSILLSNLDWIKTFKMSKYPSKDENQRIYLTVESLTDSVYAVGKPAKFQVKFDSSSTVPTVVQLKNPAGAVQTFSLSRPGLFMFVPELKGRYQIKFVHGAENAAKYVKVMDLEPVLQNNQMGTLYIGIDNALNIKTSEFEDTEGLTARISEGQILQKGKNFYARVAETGMVSVEVFAKLEFGFVKVAEKRFVVRELNPPVAQLISMPSGSEIPQSNISKLRTLEVSTNEFLVNEQFYISSFDFTIIYNNHTSILQPIKHSGSSLNTVAIDALKRTKTGDVLIFNNIKAKSSLGKDMDITPVTYTIK